MGRISSRGYEDGIQISAGPSLFRARFLALSFMFKTDWQGNSDAATWSIGLLIRVPTLRNPDVNHPPTLCLCKPGMLLSDYSPVLI